VGGGVGPAALQPFVGKESAGTGGPIMVSKIFVTLSVEVE
jgi:hypothetical protein